MKRRKVPRGAPQRRVSEKISKLRNEGEPEDKAVATAINMEHAGRLRKGGKYVRVGRKSRRRK